MPDKRKRNSLAFSGEPGQKTYKRLDIQLPKSKRLLAQ